ncbi:N-acetylmuramoyl-L-alanine amidase [Malaciobacter molluscorum LMG 25693]|uniref:N-acetylmuramoyl-L-alanine amidase n=2 Tax=Malaciobacter molluscorum LMG 25693 TaxID=870501 RepID=A0A2G1DFT7_9BACT|nr:N-acetylmuramoyl-L-alanine amidase [Malaciobacter molluscorum LMG 25693]
MFLSFLIIFNLNLLASSVSDKYNAERMSYLRAVLDNNTALEKKHLENIISYGEKLGYNTTKYKNELKKLSLKNKEKFNKIKKQSIQKDKLEKEYAKKDSISQKIDLKNSIQKVYTQKNMIIIDFNKHITKKDIDYNIDKTKYFNLYLFDINGFFKDAGPTKLSILGIDKIFIIQKDKKTLHIKVRDKNRLKPIYIINNKRIIIKFLNIKISDKKEQKQIATKIIQEDYKRKIVVIDAGHGGKDAGAVGPHKRYEKHVVLAIAKYLYHHLKNRGYKAYITRKTDKFIKVRNRTVLANKLNADIFISIHANSIAKSKANKIKGVETFFLSPARSARAKRVAAKENSSDIRSMSLATKKSFLTVLNQSKITASNKLAIDVQQNMLYQLKKHYRSIEDGGVREGPFWVLVGAQMPSILIEVGYISHPMESRRLYNKRYQKILAEGIANGVDSYFLKNP